MLAEATKGDPACTNLMCCPSFFLPGIT